MQFDPMVGASAGEYLETDGLAEDLVTAHARTLARAVSGEFERQTRRTPFASPARVAALASALLREFGEDLLNDLLMMTERQRLRSERGARPASERPVSLDKDERHIAWAMMRLSEALIDGADALEEASPPAMRQSVSSALQICRVDFEWRCRAALGLPSPTGGAESDLFDRGGIW